MHILHFDAHTDLREEYLGATLSHASVIRRAWDLVGDDKIWQYGIRSGMKEEFYWAKEHTHLHKFNLETLDLFLKYNVVTTETDQKLIDNGKLKIDGAQSIIDKYKEMEDYDE